MTRAGNGAQRSGAPALPLVFARQREDYGDAVGYFASTYFFAPRTPARWHRQRLWAWSGQRCPAGSLVLIGSGGRTAKRLKSIGSTVLFQSLSRDACTAAGARVRKGIYQNHRTLELKGIIVLGQLVSGSVAVLLASRPAEPFEKLCRLNGLPVLVPNKQRGGYSASAFAGPSSADQGLDRGAADGKFWRRARLAGAAGEVGRSIGAAGGNRAISAACGSPIGRVGTAMLERGGNVVAGQCLVAHRLKPARLAAVDLPGCATPPGGDAASRGGTPPNAAPLSPLPQAQPIFQVSAAPRIRREPVDVGDRDGRLISSAEMGSGDRTLSRAARDRREGAVKSGQRQRVGVQGAIQSWGRSRERSTLWGGSGRVN